MENFILFFRCQEPNTATPWNKAVMSDYYQNKSTDGRTMMAALVPGRSIEDAWRVVFRSFPDYTEHGNGKIEECQRCDEDNSPLPVTLQDVLRTYDRGWKE